MVSLEYSSEVKINLVAIWKQGFNFKKKVDYIVIMLQKCKNMFVLFYDGKQTNSI